MSALEDSKGTGLTGGKGRDQVKVKRRVVITVPEFVWHGATDHGFDTSQLVTFLSL